MIDQISVLLTSDPLLACATCMGDAGSLTNKAAGYAIAFMLVMLSVVLGSLIKFMSYLAKREKGIGVGDPLPVRLSNDPN
jgi:hypothetical protein